MTEGISDFDCCEPCSYFRLLAGRDADAARRLHDVGADLVRVLDLRVVLGRIADHLAGVDDAPEFPGVARDAVEDLVRDAMLVLDVRRLNRFHDKLDQIALADVGTEVALEGGETLLSDRAIWEEGRHLQLAGRTNPDLDVLELSAA